MQIPFLIDGTDYLDIQYCTRALKIDGIDLVSIDLIYVIQPGIII
jgi:hypothetical protein